MTDHVRSILADAIRDIAPDVDLEALDADAPFQEEADIDSMDFLNLMTNLYETAGIDVPESDYAKLSTLNDIIRYLDAAIEGRSSPSR